MLTLNLLLKKAFTFCHKLITRKYKYSGDTLILTLLFQLSIYIVFRKFSLIFDRSQRKNINQAIDRSKQ